MSKGLETLEKLIRLALSTTEAGEADVALRRARSILTRHEISAAEVYVSCLRMPTTKPVIPPRVYREYTSHHAAQDDRGGGPAAGSPRPACAWNAETMLVPESSFVRGAVFHFGKYKDKPLHWVWRRDRSYLRWLAGQDLDKMHKRWRDAIRYFAAHGPSEVSTEIQEVLTELDY